VALLTVASHAQAAPVYYQFTSGSAEITATTGATTLTPVPAVLTLDGMFAEFDELVPALTDFSFTTAPNQPIFLSAPYGGYDEIVVNSAAMTPGVGYYHASATDNGGGSYSVTVLPVHVSGIYSAMFSGGPPPAPVSNVPIMYDNASPLLATINVITGTFTLEGITLAVIPLPGEPSPLVVKADLTFQGMVPVPEPGVSILIGLGLAGLIVRRSRCVCAVE
jgi:hypothetical protein